MPVCLCASQVKCTMVHESVIDTGNLHFHPKHRSRNDGNNNKRKPVPSYKPRSPAAFFFDGTRAIRSGRWLLNALPPFRLLCLISHRGAIYQLRMLCGTVAARGDCIVLRGKIARKFTYDRDRHFRRRDQRIPQL